MQEMKVMSMIMDTGTERVNKWNIDYTTIEIHSLLAHANTLRRDITKMLMRL